MPRSILALPVWIPLTLALACGSPAGDPDDAPAPDARADTPAPELAVADTPSADPGPPDPGTPDPGPAEVVPPDTAEATPDTMPPGITPIEALNADDAQGVALLLGQEVTIRGVVTVPTGVFSVENHELYVQDATGGVSVYEDKQQSVPVALGDRVEVQGAVGQYAGKTELGQPRITRLAMDDPLPEPVALTTAQLLAGGEAVEGRLIVIRGVRITGGEAWPTVEQEGNFNLFIDDGSGAASLRIDHQTELNGSPKPAEPFDVVGVVKQYDETAPYTTGYSVQPRYRTDLTPAGEE